MSRAHVFGYSVLGLVLALVGCGGDTVTNVAQCGPGTVPVDGVCVVADGGSSESGTDAGSEQDGSITPDASPDSVASDGEPDSDIGDAPPGDTASSGDPCPTVPIAVNCSTSCGGKTVNCAPGVTCSTSPGTDPGFTITNEAQLPLVLRTPDKPGIDPNCPKDCADPPGPAFTMRVRMAFSPSSPGVRVTVGAPWEIHRAFVTRPYCPDIRYPKPQCHEPFPNTEFIVTTTDPDAPSRNILIEKEGPCP